MMMMMMIEPEHRKENAVAPWAPWRHRVCATCTLASGALFLARTEAVWRQCLSPACRQCLKSSASDPSTDWTQFFPTAFILKLYKQKISKRRNHINWVLFWRCINIVISLLCYFSQTEPKSARTQFMSKDFSTKWTDTCRMDQLKVKTINLKSCKSKVTAPPMSREITK